MQENDYTLYDYLKPILTGGIISLLLSGVFLFIFALVMTKIDFPFSIINPISIAILGISTLIGSFVGANGFRRKGFFIGLSVSLLVFLVLLLLNLSMDPQGFGTVAIVKGCTVIICGILGGVLGVNKRKNAKFKI